MSTDLLDVNRCALYVLVVDIINMAVLIFASMYMCVC
jgi:hypothetical protein